MNVWVRNETLTQNGYVAELVDAKIIHERIIENISFKFES